MIYFLRPVVDEPVEYEDTPEFRQSLNMEGAAKEAILKKLRDRVGMKQVKEKKGDVKPGSNPKVQWHGSKGEHGTHNGAKKGDVYITLKPSMSANNLAHPGKAVPSGGSGY